METTQRNGRRVTTQTESNTDTPKTVVLDRREFTRFPSRAVCVTLRRESGESTVATVEVESIRGIALWLDSNIGLMMCETVCVVCDKLAMPAIVRRVEAHDDGMVFAMLEWTTPEPSVNC